MLVFTSCRDSAVSSVLDLRTEPEDVLDFGRTAIGATQTAQIRIENASRFDLRVEFIADAPFSVDSEAIIPAAASMPVVVRFSPDSDGDVVRTLRLRSDGFERNLVLRGVAVIAECAPSSPCERAIANVDGTCTMAAQPDGTACADLCVSGVCMAGTCTGTSVDCDDHDACTIDACAPSVGCVSTPACESSDPCQVPTCDPASVCGLAPVVDGTPCGVPEACTTHVCMAGVCTAATLPDGAACATNIPCRPNGTCAQGRCDAGPFEELDVDGRAFTLNAPLSALIDDNGNVVVRSSGHGVGTFAYGLSPAGTQTWSVQGLVVVHGDTAYHTGEIGSPPGVYAIDPATGAQRWFIPDVNLVAAGSPWGPEYLIRKSFPGLDSAGDMVFDVALVHDGASSAVTCVSEWRVAIDPTTGSVMRSGRDPSRCQPLFLVSDGTGIEYSVDLGGAISVADASGPLWSLSNASKLVGAAGGYAFVISTRTCHEARTLRVLDGRTGTELVDAKMYPHSVVSDGSRVFVLGWALKPRPSSSTCIRSDSDLFDKAMVAIIDPRNGSVLSVPFASSRHSFSDLVLTDKGTVVFAQSGDDSQELPGAITEVDSTGNVTSKCAPLGEVHSILLDDERLYIGQEWSGGWSLTTVDLPGLRPAQRGWINSMGNNGGTMSALP